MSLHRKPGCPPERCRHCGRLEQPGDEETAVCGPDGRWYCTKECRERSNVDPRNVYDDVHTEASGCAGCSFYPPAALLLLSLLI